jgi:hypothetical protein
MASKPPFYIGYYPGDKPLSRRPGGGGKSPFQEDHVPSFSDSLLSSLSNVLVGIPKWLIDREVDEVETAWKSNYYGKYVVTSEGLTAGGQEEVEDMPGKVTVGGTLDPREWAKDPMKQVESFLVNPIKSLADIDDFTQRAHKKLWVGTEEQSGFLTAEDSPYNLTAEGDGFIEIAGKDMYVSPTGTDLGVGKNVYKDVVKNVGDYKENNKAFFFRNGSAADMNQSIITALGKEVSFNRRRRLADGRLEYFDTRFSTPAQQAAADRFLDKVDVVETVFGDIPGTYDPVKNFSQKGLSDSFSDLTDLLEKDIFNPKRAKAAANTKVIEKFDVFTSSLEKSRAAIDKVKSNGGIDAKEVAALHRYVDNLDKIVKKHTAEVSGKRVLKPGSETSFLRALNIQGKKFERNTVDAGVGRAYLRTVVSHDVIDDGSALNTKIIGVPTRLTTGEILGAVDAAGNPIMGDTSRRLRLVASTMHRDYRWQVAGELVDDITKGKIPNKFIWTNIIGPKVQTWTPHHWIGRVTTRLHKFGLVVDEDVLKGDAQGVNFFINKFPGVSGLFDHNIRIKDLKVTISAGGYLSNILKLSKEVPNYDFMKEGADFVSLLNGDFAGLDITRETAGILEKVRKKLLTKSGGDDFKEVKKLRDILGITIDETTGKLTGGDNAKISTFLHNLETSTLHKVTKSKIGFLERYSGLLSRVQKSKIMAVVRLPTYAWTKVTQKVFRAVERILMHIFGDASGGVGWVIMWVVRLGVQFLLKKLKGTLEEAWKALKKFDIDYFFNLVNEAVAQLGKYVVIFLTLQLILITFIILLILSPILSKLQIFDSSKTCGNVSGRGSCYNVLDFVSIRDPIPVDVTITGSSIIECFTAQDADGAGLGAWPEDIEEGVLNTAINSLKQNGGSLLDDLCATGVDIEIYWMEVPQDSWCGMAYNAGQNKIVFRNNSFCFKEIDGGNYFEYLFAHEVGHVMEAKFPELFKEFVAIYDGLEEYAAMPSYPGCPGGLCTYEDDEGNIIEEKLSRSETFAEIIGNMILQNTHDNGSWDWGSYPEYVDFFKENFSEEE